MSTATAAVGMVQETCCACSIVFWMPADFQKRRRDDHNWFYCPAGHAQHYSGKSEAEKLRDQLEQTKRLREYDQQTAQRYRADAEQQRRRAAAARGQVTRIRNRVKNGVCPCCTRSFDNLRRHMDSEHPHWSAGSIGEAAQ